jgi:hypothetical protein
VKGQAVSDENGFYRIYGLPAVTYTVTANKMYVTFEPGWQEPAPVVTVPPPQDSVNFRSVAEVMGAPSIAVELPNGGEVWDVGSTNTLCWSSIAVYANVTVELSRDGGATYETLFADIANDGQEDWLVTAPVTENALIRVRGTGTDEYGKEVEVSDVSDEDFTIRDNAPPELTAPADVIAEQSSAAGTAVDLGAPQVSDNGDPDPTVTNDAPAVFPLGVTVVTWTATDSSGNVATATQTVIVVDTTPPEITVEVLGGPYEQQSEAGTFFSHYEVEVTATDICDADPEVTFDPPEGSTLPLGAHEITVTATDDSGNSATDTFSLEVVDTTPPELTVPADVTAEQTNRDGTPVSIGQATATDLCDADVAITNDAPAVFPLGETVVTWAAKDASGNTATATQTVTIVDTTKPDLTVPADITQEQTSLAGTEKVDLGQATATDICDADVAITNDAPDVFPLGKTVVTWAATDDAGNIATGTQTVTVIDTTPPVLTVPAAVTVEQATANGTVVPLTATATDLCDADVVISSDARPIYPLGTTTVTFTATDDSGNVSTGQTTVTVIDTTPPALTVPAAVTAEQTNKDGTPVNIGAATATDICDADVVITNDAPAVFPLGPTTVTWTATDDTGNSVSAEQTVTVVDTTPPTVDAGPDRRFILGETVTLPTPTVSDVCDTNPAVTDDAPDPFPVGTTLVTFTATDASGNAGTDSVAITVQTPQDAIRDLIAAVNASGLARPWKGVLTTKLQLAIFFLDLADRAERPLVRRVLRAVAIGHLGCFEAEVQQLVRHGRLDAATGAAWRAKSARIRAAIAGLN